MKKYWLVYVVDRGVFLSQPLIESLELAQADAMRYAVMYRSSAYVMEAVFLAKYEAPRLEALAKETNDATT